MGNGLPLDELKRLARLGASARLQQIEEERKAILRAFPGLAAAGARQAPTGPAEAGAPLAQGRKRRGRRRMTAAEKKAASDRMKRIWEARKQQG